MKGKYKLLILFLVFLIVPTIVNALIDNNNVTAYYVPSNGFYDATGKYNATPNTATYSAYGVTNGTYFYNEVNDNTTTPINESKLKVNQSWALTFWLNSTSKANADIISDRLEPSGNTGKLLRLSTDNLNIFIGNNTAMNSISTITTHGVWIFYAITYNQGNLSFYKNAVLVNTTTANYVSSGLNYTIGIGRGGANYYQGEIADIGIWQNTTLDINDLYNLYNGGSGFAYPFTFNNTICVYARDMATNTGLNQVNLTLSGSNVYNFQVNNTYCKQGIVTDDYVLIAQKTGYTTYSDVVNINGSGQVNKIIYLTNSGATIAIYAKNIYDQYISGARVTITKNTDGALIIDKLTDSTGGTTAVIDTNLQYTLNITANGYNSYSGSLQPTSTTFLITLSQNTSTSPNYYAGVTPTFLPYTTTLIGNNTNQQFYFNYTSTYWNVTNCYLTLTHINNTLINSTTFNTCNVSNGSVNITQYTSNYSYIQVNSILTINVNGTSYNITYKQLYAIKYYYVGDYSIMHAVTDFKNFNKSGFNDSNRFLIVFIIVFAVTIAGARSSINAYTSSSNVLLLLFALTLTACYLDLCHIPFIPDTSLYQVAVARWGIALLVGLLWFVTFMKNATEGNDGG
jgi:hypothetical protein